MVFVDGENLAVRGQQELDSIIDKDTPNPFFEPGTFLWIPTGKQARVLKYFGLNQHLFPPAIRSYYITAMKSGNEKDLEKVVDRLIALDFSPIVHETKKGKTDENRPSKLVDQTLTVTALHHAYLGNYDTAIIVSGDSDYIPLFEELNSIGKRTHLAFFKKQTPDSLRRKADRFLDITSIFERYWKIYLKENKIAFFDGNYINPIDYKIVNHEFMF